MQYEKLQATSNFSQISCLNVLQRSKVRKWQCWSKWAQVSQNDQIVAHFQEWKLLLLLKNLNTWLCLFVYILPCSKRHASIYYQTEETLTPGDRRNEGWSSTHRARSSWIQVGLGQRWWNLESFSKIEYSDFTHHSPAVGWQGRSWEPMCRTSLGAMSFISRIKVSDKEFALSHLFSTPRCTFPCIWPIRQCKVVQCCVEALALPSALPFRFST